MLQDFFKIAETSATVVMAGLLVKLVTHLIPEWQKQNRDERMAAMQSATKDREAFRETLHSQGEQFASAISEMALELKETRKDIACGLRAWDANRPYTSDEMASVCPCEGDRVRVVEMLRAFEAKYPERASAIRKQCLDAKVGGK